jgi:hypothetical protein
MQQPKTSALRAVKAERRRLLRERRRSAPPAHALLPHGTHVHGTRPPFWERQWLATYELLVQGPLPAAGTPRKRARRRSNSA